MRLVQERELRGIPIWLVKSYLEELGGQESGDRVQGKGWSARLVQLEDYQIGSIRVGQVLLELEVEEEIQEEFTLRLDRKLLRAGG